MSQSSVLIERYCDKLCSTCRHVICDDCRKFGTCHRCKRRSSSPRIVVSPRNSSDGIPKKRSQSELGDKIKEMKGNC